MAGMNMQDDSQSLLENNTNPSNATKFRISDDVRYALDLIPHLIWMSKFNVGYGNLAFRNYFGDVTHFSSVKDWLVNLHPQDKEHIYNIWESAQKTGRYFEKECRIKNKDGIYHWFLVVAQSQFDQNVHSAWTITCTLIHDRAVQLRETTEQLRTNTDMLDASVDCIKIITPDGKVSHMNKSGCNALLGCSDVKKFDMEWLSLLPPEVREQGTLAIQTAASGQNSRFAGKSTAGGQTMYWDNILTPVVNEKGETTRILCVSRDITLQRVAEQKLLYTSNYDELTGLMNRRAFKTMTQKVLKQAQKNHEKVALLLLDLDHFKNVNDTLGHLAGDHLLKILSKRLQKSLPEQAYVARLGGDEFAIVINHVADLKTLKQSIQRILKHSTQPIKYQGKIINGGMSIGASIFPDDAKDLMNLMRYADTALNDLKEHGRGGLKMFSQDMLLLTQKKAEQLLIARQIIQKNCIVPYYQPKVCLRNRHIIGFEALMRWQDQDGTVHSPETIYEAFSDYKLASEISEIMQNKVFSDISGWLNQAIQLHPISINASPVEFMRDDYAETLLKRLKKFRIPHHLIEIEVTEHMLTERGHEFVVRALEKLKKSGVRISLDDFGTGHSSMAHLRDYPVDSLKIDYLFIQKMDQETSIHSIVEGISKLGPILNLDVIAEGIETQQQLENLLAMGCQYGQGFLFSEPMRADHAEEMMSHVVI